MKLSSFSPTSQNYELDLDYYHGKDIIHQGNLLHIDPAIAWSRISKTTRHSITKAKKLENLVIKRVKGTKKQTQAFRTIWFDPNNPTLPEVLAPDEIMYMAYLNNELVAGMILTPVRSNLYLHYMAGNQTAREQNINSYIIWHAINDLKDSAYKFIDIGVSFRKSLYMFFHHWQTENYPIIFEPPYIKPLIRLVPFEASNVVSYNPKSKKVSYDLLQQYFSDSFTILPRGINAIQALLIHLQLTKNDEVVIFTSFNTSYISRCVTEPIERVTNITRKITPRTKAVFVIHEFGYLYKDLIELKKQCEKNNIPLIEDYAWSYRPEPTIGDFVIYSLPKILPMQYGAILKGLTITDEENWSKYKMLDYYKREIVIRQLHEYMGDISTANNRRRENFRYLEKLFNNDGYAVYKELGEKMYPATILIQMADESEMNEISSRYSSFGVEVGKYYPTNAIFLPVHQNLDHIQLDYIYAIFRGHLNLCSSYKRNG